MVRTCIDWRDRISILPSACLRQEKIEKDGPPSSIRTRRPSLPIISSLKAPLARRLFHPRTAIWAFVSLLGACLLESGVTALILARFYNVTSEPHPTCKRLRRKHLSAASRNGSAPVVRRCQSQKAEIRSARRHAIDFPSSASPPEFRIRRYSCWNGDHWNYGS